MARIAEQLGVSKTAVSFVLNGKARDKGISAELAERIGGYCRQIGYRPNIHAQRMNSRHVENIGILIEKNAVGENASSFSDYNISEVVGGVAEAAHAVGYRFSFQFYSQGTELETVLEWFMSREIDGLIYYGFGLPASWHQAFSEERFNTVGVSIDPGHNVPCVNIDNYDASFKLASHLVDKGHQRFLYLAGGSNSYPGNERYRGFRDALRKAAIPFSEENVLKANFHRETAEELVRERWVHGNLKEDAIVCANDSMAIGAMSALNKAGVKIPKQVAVAGADNIDLGQFITPSLTTFDYLPFEQGKEAFNLLYGIIKGHRRPKNILLKSNLYLRNSG